MTDNTQANRSAVSKVFSRRRGFSLVELLVVVGVIVLLVGILVPGFSRAKLSMKKGLSRANISSLDKGCRQYYNEFKNIFPPSTGMGSLDGKNMIVVYLTGYADDKPTGNPDSTPGSDLSDDDGKGGWGWRTEKRGKVHGPYFGAESIPIASDGGNKKVFLDAFKQQIYYYRYHQGDLEYKAAHNSGTGPTYLNKLPHYRGDFVLISKGPDGNWGTIGGTATAPDPETGFDDISNFLE
ncbi:MAG: prepilin-type N-terminal cleavage/methylation domain-containing protein [Phycisphaerae bacterium]|nr:prepilin-type N-terminal cleavage/methylation domain-containing protein [Phycisphaerae bacterium]